MTTTTIIGMDISKYSFELCGTDERGRHTLHGRLHRDKVSLFFANLPRCTVAMESCSGSQHWARKLTALGHQVKLILAQHVVAFRQGAKNDRNDAAAIAEAATRPNMPTVPVKTTDQPDLQTLHRVRERLVHHRTALINEIRGLLDKRIKAVFDSNPVCQRLATIPGVGALVATAIVASVCEPGRFKNGRQFAAYLGLVPRQHSTGGKAKLLGISRLPEIGGDKPAKKKFAKYAIGYFHVDIAEVCTEQGRLYLFVAIDRTSKFAYAELHFNQSRDTACEFLRHLITVVPYRIHTILTDNGIRFTNRLKDRWAFKHLFDRICEEHEIEHRLTKVNHPWTNGQVERMNRTIKDATVKRYHYETHEQLKEHLAQFLAAYNFAKLLKTLRGLTPYEHISKSWQKEPERFRLNPHHHSMGLNTYPSVRDALAVSMDVKGCRTGARSSAVNSACC